VGAGDALAMLGAPSRAAIAYPLSVIDDRWSSCYSRCLPDHGGMPKARDR
jgi:hypothetical protein